MRLLPASILGICLTAAAAHGQQPAFEVATVKASPTVPLGMSIAINLGTFRSGTLTFTNVTLSECLQFAYSLVSRDQVAGPDWINSRETRFDIVAKSVPETDLDRARRMLRSLLADRFKLFVRIEQRPYSFVAIVPAKDGSKLTAAKDGPPQPGTSFRGQIVGQQ